MHISDRASRIKPFYVMELLEKAKELESRGEDIIHMEIGEPDCTSTKDCSKHIYIATNLIPVCCLEGV